MQQSASRGRKRQRETERDDSERLRGFDDRQAEGQTDRWTFVIL